MLLFVILCGAMVRVGNFCTCIQVVKQGKEAGSGSNPPTRRSQLRLVGGFDPEPFIRLFYVDFNNDFKRDSLLFIYFHVFLSFP